MWRLVDISSDDRRLSLADNAIVVSDAEKDLAKIHLSDIASVVVHSYRAMLSKNLIVALAEQGIPLVYCDSSHNPVTVSLPVAGHFKQVERAIWQAEASAPLKKQLWKQIVSAKIKEQARTLEAIDKIAFDSLMKLSKEVQSGDKGNVEAQAARIYWTRLMGEDFKRERSEYHVNPALNYGYTVLRSCVARAVVGAGLNPSLGLFHKNKFNNFCLVDDLLEPFRPMVDRIVYANREKWKGLLDAEAKTILANLINLDVKMPDGETSLTQVMFTVCNSLVEVFAGRQRKLLLPEKIEFVNQYAFGV